MCTTIKGSTFVTWCQDRKICSSKALGYLLTVELFDLTLASIFKSSLSKLFDASDFFQI